MVVRVRDLPESDYQPETLTRTEFLDVFARNYDPGEHVTFIGPTNSGKTTIAFQMLNQVATSELPAVILVMKPKDDTVVTAIRRMGVYKSERWPPATKRDWRPWKETFGKRIRGWVFWPRQSLTDIRRDDDMLSHQFGKALSDCYRQGNRIVFVDEAHAVQNELKLRPEMDAILMRGRSLGCGGWFATQRPRYVTLNMYSQAEHLILFRTPDVRDLKVYSEIGGIDQRVIADAVTDLDRFECVYIGRTKGEDDDTTMVIVKGE
jgi:energy-coupling factor transporter ATP-binding protein EcfA2